MSVYSGKTGIVQLLLSNGANPMERDLEGRVPLHIAAAEGRSDILKVLLKASKQTFF